MGCLACGSRLDDAAARRTFAEAAGFFVATVERVRPADWERPALGEWSVRDLAGHTSRALITLETYLGRPAQAVDAASAVEYFVSARASFGDPVEVARRGREAGAALGADPAATIRQLAERVVPLVAGADLDLLLATPAGGMRLRDYLATRVFELVIHTLDLAAAIGAAAEPPVAATAVSLEIAAGLALRSGEVGDVLLALTGRRPLRSGFSVL